MADISKHGPDLASLIAALDYDPTTGVFRWKVDRSNVKAGTIPTATRNGYLVIGFGGRIYYAHRLAWMIIHGVWPDHPIDHINRQRSDIRISNLRAATCAQNQQNRSPRGRFKGVGFHKLRNRWRAYIGYAGRKMVHLGTFDTEEGAARAYDAEARLRFGEFAVLNFPPEGDA